MPNDRFAHIFVAGALLVCLSGGAVEAQNHAAVADTFASVVAATMEHMDRDMMMSASGDADRDFATMMIPHHQGAVEMAEAELRFGHDPILRRLAQGMIVEQRQEIAVMHEELAELPTAPFGAVTPIHTHRNH